MAARTTRLSALGRAIRALEAVAAHPGASTTALAAATGMPPSSVSRILAEWRDGGYVDQAGRRAVWRLGPRCLALGLSGGDGDLVLAAEPALRRLHQRCACGVALAVRRGVHRINLIQFTPQPGAAELVVEADDLAGTATGRLLLAVEPRRLRRIICGDLGLPGPAWPQAVDSRELDDQLDELATAGRCELRNGSWWAVARLVPGLAAGPIAAGVYLPVTASAGERIRVEQALRALVGRLAREPQRIRRAAPT